MTSETASRQMPLIRARCKTYNVTRLPCCHVRCTKPNHLFTGPSVASYHSPSLGTFPFQLYLKASPSGNRSILVS